MIIDVIFTRLLGTLFENSLGVQLFETGWSVGFA
jgi:hypothetical protein